MTEATNRPTVLITGSSGFLGQAIARGLCDRYEVIGLDVAMPEGRSETVETIRIDLTSDESVRTALEKVRERSDGRIASVIHLAAYYDTSGKSDPKYDAVNVDGTRRLLAALRSLETEQFIFSSTLLVHAPSPRPGVAIDEDGPLEPTWAYPKSKRESEAVITKERGGIKAVVLRLAGVYDEDCRAAFIAQQIARIFERLPTAYLFSGDLGAGQPYLHKDDLVEAFVRAVDRRSDLPDESVMLIGEAETLSYGALQKRIGKLVHGEDWQTFVLPKGLAKTGAWMQTEVLEQDTDIKPWMIETADDHFEIDISRARHLLGWEPKHSLAATLPEMIRRLKEDPTDWYEQNKLEPSTVAATEPEIDQARERLRAPLERSKAQVDAAVERHRLLTLWAPLANVALGLWLLASPMTLGLFDPVTAPPPPALGHEIAEAAIRNARLGMSEIASGLLIVVFALAGMYRRWSWLQWITATVGVWVMFAPLDECRRLRHRHARRHADPGLRGYDPSDAGNQPAGACGGRRPPPRLELFAIDLHPAHADRRARLHRPVPLPLSRRLPARPCRRPLGSILRTGRGSDRQWQ